MMTIPDLLKAKNLALKSSKLNVDIIRLKTQVEEAFNQELVFDVSLKEILPETSSNESSFSIDRQGGLVEDMQENFFAKISSIMQHTSNAMNNVNKRGISLKVEGSEAALLLGYLYEIKVREFEKVNAELKAMGIKI